MAAQTSPPSTPLDTLKHTVLATIELIEYAQDQIGGGSGDPDSWVEILDAANQRLLAGLAEHVDGVQPRGLGTSEWFPTTDVRREVYTYDDGGRVVLHLEDSDGVLHVRFPRIQRPVGGAA